MKNSCFFSSGCKPDATFVIRDGCEFRKCGSEIVIGTFTHGITSIVPLSGHLFGSRQKHVILLAAKSSNSFVNTCKSNPRKLARRLYFKCSVEHICFTKNETGSCLVRSGLKRSPSVPDRRLHFASFQTVISIWPSTSIARPAS